MKPVEKLIKFSFPNFFRIPFPELCSSFAAFDVAFDRVLMLGLADALHDVGQMAEQHLESSWVLG